MPYGKWRRYPFRYTDNNRLNEIGKAGLIVLLFLWPAIPIKWYCKAYTANLPLLHKTYNMKKIIVCFIAIALTYTSQAQLLGLGVKAGYNAANVTTAAGLNPSGKSGFHIGGFFNKGVKVIGFRTEVIYSKQGYDFKKGTTTGSVALDYIMLPQLLTINFGKKIQFQAGGQLSILLNASADSTTSSGGSGPYAKVEEYFNKLDYGAAAGIELFPYKGLLLGARYNISLSNLYKGGITPGTGTPPSFLPNINDLNFKNNLVQIYAGWRF